MQTPKFSLVLIAKNETKTLPKAMKSLEEFTSRGGEVILLDTGSTDGTAELARSLGCTVTEVGEKFIKIIDKDLADNINEVFIRGGEAPIVKDGNRLFDFAAARNYATSLASNDMICSLDADEAYTNFDIDILNQLIEDGYEQFEYNFVFSHDSYGKPAIKFIQSKFFDRRKIQWTGVVHEVLSGTGKRLLLPEDTILLEHYQIPGGEHRGNYLVGLALDCYENQDKERQSHYLAREMLWTNRPHSALAEFQRHTEMNGWPAERAQSMIFMGDCYSNINQPERQIAMYNKAFYHDPNRREAIIKIARFYKKNNQPLLVKMYAEMALNIPWTDYYANDRSMYEQEPHELLYWTYGWLGDIDNALKHISKCLEYLPGYHIYLHELHYYLKVSICIPTLGRPEKLKRLIDSIHLNAGYDNYEIIVREDQPIPNNVGAPKMLKECVKDSKGQLVMFLGNDCIGEKDFLKEAVFAMARAFPNLDGMIGLNDQHWPEGYVATHWLASKALLPHLGGEFFNTNYHHVGCDNELQGRCELIGKYKWSENAKIFHDHPVNSKWQKGVDEIYNDSYHTFKHVHDIELLKKRAKELGFESRL